MEWATPSKQSEFRRATLVLTSYYTAGVLVILLIFNIIVYGLFVTNIHTIQEKEFEQYEIYEDEQFEAGELRMLTLKDDLIFILLISDAIILLITLLLAYFLAKLTLAPVELAYQKHERFVSDAAHELRTPLAVIQAGSQVILRKKRSVDEYINYIQESLDEVKRLTILSNDLLFLARSNQKQIKHQSLVSFSEICTKQIKAMLPYAQTKKIELKNKISENVVIRGNESDLIRLVVNLLKNAIDNNKVNGSVTIALEQRVASIVFTVKDTGIGISKKDLSLIFERFYKADNARTRNSTGTGLGLAIVKEIVDEHFGSISAKSTLNKNTIFRVVFPTV